MTIRELGYSCAPGSLGSSLWRRVFRAVICAGALGAHATAASAADVPAKEPNRKTPWSDGTLYAGPAIAPLEITGLEEIHASDWEYFGTDQDEGRIELPLQRGNTSGVQFGARAGYRLRPELPALAEIGVYFGKATLITLAAGVDLYPVRGKVLSFGVTPKVGYLVGLVDAGEAEVLPGKTPPVITPSGTFHEGDSVSGMLSGPFVQVAATSMIRLSDMFGLRLDVGYQHAWVGNFKVKAGDVELDGDAPALVKADGSTTQAGIDPKAKSSGITALAAVTVSF